MLEKIRSFLAIAWARTLRGFWRATALFSLVVLFAMLTPASNRMAGGLVVSDELRKADVIAVLGGGAHRSGALSGASNERLIHGLRLLKAGYAPTIYFAGGTIIDTKAKVTRTIAGTDKGAQKGLTRPDVVEASIMKNIALELGIPEQAIRVDAESSDTHENLATLKKYMEASGISTCLVVTSPVHMYRSRGVYKKLGLDCSFAPVADYTGEITSATGRLSLMRAVLWEYSAIALYMVLGYI